MNDTVREAQPIALELRPDSTVADIAVHHPQLRPCLEQLGIDYCCGGKQTLAAAVHAAGLEWPAALAALRAAAGSPQPSDPATDWRTAPLAFFADHVVATHHAFLKSELPRLDALLSKVQNAHQAQHGAMLRAVRRVFGSLRSELEAHLMKEEQILFPAIKAVDAFVSGTGVRPVVHCGSVAHPIRQMEHEHDGAGNALAELRRLTDSYRLPPDVCRSVAALYDGFKAMEADLHEHIHLENNILFPRSLAREEAMKTKEA